jgi:hypothetical protein
MNFAEAVQVRHRGQRWVLEDAAGRRVTAPKNIPESLGLYKMVRIGSPAFSAFNEGAVPFPLHLRAHWSMLFRQIEVLIVITILLAGAALGLRPDFPPTWAIGGAVGVGLVFDVLFQVGLYGRGL